MRIHRFYLKNIDISTLLEGKVVVTHETDLIHQLKNVFKVKVGQHINVFNKNMGEFEVEIRDISKKDMSIVFVQKIRDISDNKRQIVLYMSIIKNSNFDLVIEKAVELGVTDIVPVLSERTIKHNLNYERLSRIIKEATEQSGRMDLMTINELKTLPDAITDSIARAGQVYFGAIENGSSWVSKDGTASLFVGPEGGYTDTEIDLFIKNKITPLRLGGNVLRAETAAIVGCGLLAL